ncbi:olfactory receptor 5AR1-like [Ambystoma mexicanum]|uniref:olfactory receptor 5AR1-like n=1 Tax=Ambystoma mexicanum TaxID=8296 RepID=UPI0037E77DBE
MHVGNGTSVTEFVLLGLTDDPVLQAKLFVLFLLVYIFTFLGNSSMIILIRVAPQLHTPMYFFLFNLSFVDLCYSSAITPNMLANMLSRTKVISLPGCATQMFCYIALASSDGLLLSVMAYDRYNAICNPLLYHAMMNKRFCLVFVAGMYIFSVFTSLIHTSFTFQLSFCGPNKILNFYCDIPPLLELSCSDTSLNELVTFVVGGSVQVGSLLIVLTLYAYIIAAILRIRTSKGKMRAFSTCASHLASITVLYIPVLFMYLRPQSSYSMSKDRFASICYTVLIPMLNPVIYSLRNKDVKEALAKVVESSCLKTY